MQLCAAALTHQCTVPSLSDSRISAAYSRTMLRVMDFVGNWGYGVSVPERYFTREGFARLAKEQHLVITAIDSGLDLYEHLPGMGKLLRPDWQFIAVLHVH